MTSNQFRLSSTNGPDGLVVRARGRLALGHGASDDLWQRHVCDARRVSIDLTGITELDARGVGVPAALAHRARQTGVALSVAGASRVARTVAALVRLDQVLVGTWDRGTVRPTTLRASLYAHGRRRQTSWANPIDPNPRCFPSSTTS